MAEFDRAGVWQERNKNIFRGSLERALELIDLTVADPRWATERRMLLGLRDEVASFYAGTRTESVSLLSRTL